jgi:dihydrofolate reductase
MMRKIISITQTSLDGVMQAPGGPEEDPRGGFTLGGWAMPFGDEAWFKVMNRLLSADFDMLLGRRTYEIFAGYWPHAGDNPIANAFNKATKYVATRSLKQLGWKKSVGIGGDAVEGVRRLKASKGPELHIWGSGELLQTLIGAGLVDEFHVWTVPVVLGKGKRLFEPGAPAHTLSLVETQASSTGVLLNVYRPAGPLAEAQPPEEPPSKEELLRRKKLADEEAGAGKKRKAKSSSKGAVKKPVKQLVKKPVKKPVKRPIKKAR